MENTLKIFDLMLILSLVSVLIVSTKQTITNDIKYEKLRSYHIDTLYTDSGTIYKIK